MFTLFAAVASAAAPTFVAMPADPAVRPASPTELATAQRLYAAAAKCTGWEPKVARVSLGYASLPPYLGGVATPVGADFELVIDVADPEALAHEVAHLWFHGGHDALTEGRAEVLGLCALRLDPVYAAPVSAVTSTRFDDLRTWRYEPERFSAGDGAYYVASRLLLTAIAEAVGEATVFRADVTTWEPILEALRAKDEIGRRIADQVAAGPEGQRALLSNDDRDDWPLVLELVHHTDPNRWDSDGDGWWDGAGVVPSGATVIFADDTFTCLPRMALADGSVLRVHRRDANGRVVESEHVVGTWTYKLGFPEGSPNGWVIPGAGRWGRNDQCGSNPYATVTVTKWEDKPSMEAVDPLLAALPKAWKEAQQQLGLPPSPRRLRIEVGGDQDFVTNNGKRPIVHLSSYTLRAARKDWTLPGKLAIAAQVMSESGRRFAIFPGAVDAFAGWLFPSIGGKLYFSDDPREVRRWQATAAKCATSWRGLLDGSCPAE